MAGTKADKWYAPHDSAQELYFNWWLDDLDERGLIHTREVQPTCFDLAGPVTFEMITQLVTKTKQETKTLEAGHIYTPDVLVFFRPEMRPFVNVFGEPTTKEKRDLLWCHQEDGGSLRCWIEVKPNGYDAHNMLRLAKINQKWVFEKFGKMVNIAKIGNNHGSFFEKTFTPTRYLQCDRTLTPGRTIKFDPISVETFLKEKCGL